MQRLKRISRLFGVSLWMMVCAIAGPAYAHDVQNSEIRTIFGEDERTGSIEVWQTTPLEIAYGAAHSRSDQREAAADLADDDVLKIIGKQMRIEAAAGPCDLTKQAHRRVHHGTRLQMRFLFVCPDGERPTQMTFGWMAQTPSGHFAVLQQNSGQGSPFKVIERGSPVIKFERF